MFHVRHNVGSVTGMEAAAGDEPPGILFGVIGDELVDAVGESDDFRSNVVDEHGTVDAGGVHVFEEGFGITAKLGDFVVVGALLLHEFKRMRLEHFERLDVDVAVGNHSLAGLAALLGSVKATSPPASP